MHSRGIGSWSIAAWTGIPVTRRYGFATSDLNPACLVRLDIILRKLDAVFSAEHGNRDLESHARKAFAAGGFTQEERQKAIELLRVLVHRADICRQYYGSAASGPSALLDVPASVLKAAMSCN